MTTERLHEKIPFAHAGREEPPYRFGPGQPRDSGAGLGIGENPLGQPGGNRLDAVGEYVKDTLGAIPRLRSLRELGRE